jgi:hypothetical protein
VCHIEEEGLIGVCHIEEVGLIVLRMEHYEWVRSFGGKYIVCSI